MNKKTKKLLKMRCSEDAKIKFKIYKIKENKDFFAFSQLQIEVQLFPVFNITCTSPESHCTLFSWAIK